MRVPAEPRRITFEFETLRSTNAALCTVHSPSLSAALLLLQTRDHSREHLDEMEFARTATFLPLF